MATRKTTGDLATRRGAGDPETRAEWTTVSRYGHLQSALVVVDAYYARSGNRLHSVQPCVVFTRFGASSMASCLSVDAQTRRCDPTRSLFRKFTWSAERSVSPAHPLPSRAVGVTAPPLFLQGNGAFAVDTEIVSQRRVSQQQHLSRDCPISQVFWCSLGTQSTMKSCLRHTAGMRVPRAYHLSDPQA